VGEATEIVGEVRSVDGELFAAHDVATIVRRDRDAARSRWIGLHPAVVLIPMSTLRSFVTT
jgi:hypothetical protein